MRTSKYAALEEIFLLEDYFSKWPSNKITAKAYLDVISRPSYSLAKELPLSPQSLSSLHKKIVPDKQGTIKTCTYLLSKYGKKFCPKCETVYSLDNFYPNKDKRTGRDSYCKKCFCKMVVPARRATEAKKRANRKSQTPKWADVEKIKHIYANCAYGNHIDHIIPLKGELVCGLHVENNLQEISAEQNIIKSNKFDPHTFEGP
jgi:hypothetical protein